MAKKKTGKKPRRRRWNVSCEATVRVTREFLVLASTAEEAMRICRERTASYVDSGLVIPAGEFEIETERESDWRTT